MKPLELAKRYIDDIFFTGSLDDLHNILHPDLSFIGPYAAYDSAKAYIDALKANPFEGVIFERLGEWEDATSACIVYLFSGKTIGGVNMAQTFEIEDGKIKNILLIFDAAQLPESMT